MMYAATDALIAVRIFTRLIELKVANNRSRLDGMSEADYWALVKSMCQGIVDVKALKKRTANGWHKVQQVSRHGMHGFGKLFSFLVIG